VGAALRLVRRARALTLADVGERSNGEFKPTAVAAYERGERSISLQRFCDLCAFYGVAPELVLAEVTHGIGEAPEEVIDLTQLEERQPR